MNYKHSINKEKGSTLSVEVSVPFDEIKHYRERASF
jgi:hypothetical protein